MTQLEDAPATRATWRPRTQLDVVADQLAAIDEFSRARRRARTGAAERGLTREERLDLDREIAVREREHQALVARLQAQLEQDVHPLLAAPPHRLVVAHRNEWFVGKLVQAMQGHGVEVVARLDNGADAIGTLIAEQPDLALVEDALQMVPGAQVVREVRALCPGTVVAAQVGYSDRVGALLDAGAAAVFTRSVPPVEVADRLRALLAEP